MQKLILILLLLGLAGLIWEFRGTTFYSATIPSGKQLLMSSTILSFRIALAVRNLLFPDVPLAQPICLGSGCYNPQCVIFLRD